MGIKKAQRYCPVDDRMVFAERQTPNHLLHLLLSIVTGGLWLIVWLLVALFTSGAYRCPICGSKTLPYAPKRSRELA